LEVELGAVQTTRGGIEEDSSGGHVGALNVGAWSVERATLNPKLGTQHAELKTLNSKLEAMKKYSDDDLATLIERVDALGGYL
jgi:hypothetical protein